MRSLINNKVSNRHFVIYQYIYEVALIFFLHMCKIKLVSVGTCALSQLYCSGIVQFMVILYKKIQYGTSSRGPCRGYLARLLRSRQSCSVQ